MKHHRSEACSVLAKWPFYLAAFVLLTAACSIWHVAYVWDKPYFPSWQLITTVAIMLLASGVVFVWPHALGARLQVLGSIPDSVRELENILSDADSVIRSYGKARMATEALREAVEAEKQAFEQMRETVLQDLMDIKHKDLELQEARREFARVESEVQAWQQTTIDYFDYLQRALECYDEDDVRKPVVAKAAEVLDKLIQPRELVRIAPSPGDPFVDEVHQAEKEEESGAVEPGCILRCEQWGYRVGSDVAQSARVVLSKAPAEEAVTAHGGEEK